jgi:hypothetical protein
MTRLRVFVSYESTDAAFATQLTTDLRNAGTEVITDRAEAVGIVPSAGPVPGVDPLSGADPAQDSNPTSTDLDDVTFEEFLGKELPQCEYLIVVQTPAGLQSPHVRAVVDAALKLVQAGQMKAVLRVIAPPRTAAEAPLVPLRWAKTPEFDASQDYPRALARLCLHLGIDASDVNVPTLPGSSIEPLGQVGPQGNRDKSPVTLPFLAQRSTGEDRPLRSHRYPHIRLRWRLFLLSFVMALILVVAGVAVLTHQSPILGKTSPTVTTPTSIAVIHTPTPTVALTPTPEPTPTSMPTPTATPTPISVPALIPTPTPVPTSAPRPTPTPVPTSPPKPTPTPTPTCSGSGCDGKDPHSVNGPHGVPCSNDGAYVVAHQLVQYGVVSLWYSAGCGTNWSETVQTGGTNYIANANITRSSDGRRYDGTWYSSDVWTKMVYAPNITTNACGSINNAPGGCTGYY